MMRTDESPVSHKIYDMSQLTVRISKRR